METTLTKLMPLPYATVPRDLSNDEVLALLERYHRYHEEEARESLVMLFSPLAGRVARRFLDTGEPIEDLTQEAFIGLLTAIERFEPVHGVKFSTFAYHHAIGTVRHYLRDKGATIREPAWSQDMRRTVKKAEATLDAQLDRPPTPIEVAVFCGITEEMLEEVQEAELIRHVFSLDQGTDTEPAIDPDKVRSMRSVSFQLPLDERIVMQDAISSLKPLEQKVLHHFFQEGLSQSDIARSLSVSVNYVSYLVRTASKHLRQRLTHADVLERQHRQQNDDVEASASVVDSETGLYTQQYFMERLNEETVRSRAAHRDLSAVWLRIVPPGPPGSRVGGAVSAALALVAAYIKGAVRKCDIPAHWDSGTFGILLPHTGETAKALQERLLTDLGSLDFGPGTPPTFVGCHAVFSKSDKPATEMCLLVDGELERAASAVM